MGEITNIVRRYVPATYRAMVEATSTSKLFATSDLQALADYVKFRLFSTVVASSDEATAYNPFVRQFIGKLTTIQFIPAAIDYWDSQLDSKTTTGTNEVVQYRNQREGLLELLEELTKQVEAEFPEVTPGITLRRRGLIPKVTYGDNGRGIMLTPDPMDFGKMYDDPSALVWWRPWDVVE